MSPPLPDSTTEAPDGAPVPEAAAQILSRCAVFRRCTAVDLQALAAAARFVDLAPGDDLVREGEAADTMLVLAAGEAQVLKRGDTGVDHSINQLQAGDAIGEMALFDRVPRSATVRAVGPVRALVLPLSEIVALATSRSTMVPVLVDMGALVSERLRLSSASAVAATERTLAEERTRSVMGRFTLLLMLAYTIYTWVLGTAVQLKASLGRSEFITVPAIVVCVLIMGVFVRVSGYPARFFGLTLQNAGRDAVEAVLLTLPLLVGTVVLKLALVAWVPSMQGAHLFQMWAPPVPGMPETGFNPWLALAYVVFAPFQELIYRGGVQGSLSHFLSGRWRFWLANAGSNIIFSAAHLYVSPGLAVTAFGVGLFWGWLYARQGGLVGVSLSHVLLGFWAFEVVDLGVLE